MSPSIKSQYGFSFATPSFKRTEDLLYKERSASFTTNRDVSQIMKLSIMKDGTLDKISTKIEIKGTFQQEKFDNKCETVIIIYLDYFLKKYRYTRLMFQTKKIWCLHLSIKAIKTFKNFRKKY